MAYPNLAGPVLRYKAGSPDGDNRSAGCYGEIFIDDNTGFVSAATPTAEIVKATPVKAGRLNVMTADGLTSSVASAVTASGQLVAQRAGDYYVTATGDMLSGNSAVAKIELFRNAAVIADASPATNIGGSIRADLTFAGTAVKMGWGLDGCVTNVSPGDTFDLRVTSNVGTVTIKQMRFTVRQLADTVSPTPVAT